MSLLQRLLRPNRLTQTIESNRMQLTVNAYKLVQRTLTQLGPPFTRNTKEGTQTITFSNVVYIGEVDGKMYDCAVLEVDVHRLPVGLKIIDLGDDRVLDQLSRTVGYPVHARDEKRGFAYIVSFKKPRNERVEAKPLPTSAPLDLHSRPKGDYMVPFGVDGNRNFYWFSILDLLNTLVGGQPGFGKTTFLQTWIAGLTSAYPPDLVQFSIIDPKQIDFWGWGGSPYLASPIVNTSEELHDLIRQLNASIAVRRERIAGRAPDFHTFNHTKDGNLVANPIPLHLVIFDEIAEMTLLKTTADDIDAVARMAQVGRALGVIFVFATQRPGREISSMMGQLKAMCQTRVSFRVADSTNSRMILGDDISAAKLPAIAGRMVAQVGGTTLHLQGFHMTPKMLSYYQGQAGGRSTEFTDDERRIIHLAMTELSGSFASDPLYDLIGPAKDGGVSRRWLQQTLKDWEQKGWLVYDGNDAIAKRVAGPALLDLWESAS